MKLIIQIPCYNEEDTLPGTLADLPREVTGDQRIVLQPDWLSRRLNDVHPHALARSRSHLGILHQFTRVSRRDQTRRREAQPRSVALYKKRTPAIERNATGICAGHSRKTKRIEAQRARIQAPETGTITMHYSPRSLYMGQSVQALTEVQKTAGIEHKIADVLVSIAGASDGLGMGVKFISVEGDGKKRIKSYIRTI